VILLTFDPLPIVLLALLPLRRRTLAALRIGQRLVKSGDLWELDIPADDLRGGRPLDYPISIDLSQRIDLYLANFRRRIPGAIAHDGLWASNKGRPMDAGTIYDTVRCRTRKSFGFPINLLRFRHAAGPYGLSTTLRTYEVSKIFLATHRLIRRKCIALCRSRALRGEFSIGLLGALRTQIDPKYWQEPSFNRRYAKNSTRPY
jgi:hypothetical protein